MNPKAVLIYSLLFIALFTALVLKFIPKKTTPPPSTPINQTHNNLFLGTAIDHRVTIYLYNFPEKKFDQKSFEIDDFVSKNTFFKYDNASYSIQYNPQNQDIFILTDGYDGTKSSPCINKDKTCKNRIYKTNLSTLTPQLLFETDKEVNNWLIDPNTNSIHILDYIDNETFLENININTGKLNFSHLYSGYAGPLVIPQNKLLYQTFTTQSPGSKNVDLKIYEIDPKNGDVKDTKTIDTDSFFTHQTSLSPNNQYLAYYEYDTNLKKKFLNVYDFSQSKIIQQSPVENVRVIDMYWNWGSNQIVHEQDSGYWLYDLTTQKNEPIISNQKVYSWNSDLNIFIVQNKQEQVIIYDLKNKSEINFPETLIEPNVFGVAWF